MESLKNITQFNTGSTIANGEMLSNVAIEQYKASIDGLSLSQAQAALSATALNDVQKQQILTSAGLLESTQAVTLEEIKQMASSVTLSAQKKEEILTTLQGAYSEGQWNTERLEAIASGEGEAATIAQTILAKKAESAENVKNIAGRKALTASLKEELAARIALMASNPVTWIVGIAAVSVGLIALQEKFSKSLEECTEDLKNYNSEFENAQSSVESLESELDTCQTRLAELQKLADNGTLSIVEQEEYERLQKTNDELERNLKIEREKAQLNAIDGAKTADETVNKTVQSNYVRGDVDSYEGVVLHDQLLNVTPKEELEGAIAEYNRLQGEIDKLNKSYDNGSISSEDYTTQLNNLTNAQTKARTRASEMSDILVECEQSYNNLENTGGKFTTTSQQNYDSVKLANQEYSNFLDTINGVNDSFDKLDTGEKAQTLKNKYAQKTLQLENGQGSYTVEDKEISDWIDGLSDDDLSVLATINFSGEQTKESMQEALDYAKNHTDDSIETPISMGISSTIDQLNTRLKPAMDSLASAWKNVFSGDNGALNLDDLDLLSTVDTIKSKLDELNKIEGIEVDYSSFENFVQVLENTESSEDDVKEAFNELAQSIIDAGVSGAEDFETLKESLEDLGVVNNEIIAFQALVSNTELLNNSISEAGLTMDDFVDYTEDGSIVATEAAQAFIEEMVGAENATQALALLQLQQILVNENSLNTTDDINACLALAQAAGVAVEALSWLANISAQYDAAVASGNTVAQKNLSATMESIKAKIQSEVANFQPDISFDGSKGSKSASKAGKEAADAYLEAFEKELKQLQDDKDNGIITEKQYLDGLRRLYNKYFRDKKKYLDQYNKYERQYLEGTYSLYNFALSGITKLMGNQIDAYSEEKEAAVSALEEERDARLAVIDAQKEQLQSQIDLIDKEIDMKQKEIDAINDAADARKRELDLQKAQYELERARNQRTILQYNEKSGMHYVKDDSAERDAKEKVDDAKREIQIAAIEKEIDLLNEQKDLIQEQIDLLDKQAEEIEKYYEKMIAETEKYYDSLIKNMEKQKSKWEELAEVKDIADAYSAVKQVFGELGYTVEDVLNGNEQAFEDFKAKYIGLMNDMNSNASFAEGLSYASGVAKENLGSFLDSTNEAAEGLDNFGEKADAVDDIAASMDNASTSASNLSTNTEGASANLNRISDSLNNFPNGEQFSGLVTQFTDLAEAISKVAEALGIDGEGSVSSLVTALSGISEISLGDAETGLVAQFNALASAENAVSSAIGSTGGGNLTDTGFPDSKGGSATGGTSITSALDSLKQKADEVLGSGGEKSESGTGTGSEKEGGSSDGIIGQFDQLKSSVDDVSSAIGTESGETDTKNQDESTLTGAITGLGTTTEETLGESGGEGVIGRFEQFKDVIGEANEHVTGISDGLDAIDGKEVECTITVNIKQNGNLPAGFGEWTGTAMNLESGSYNAKYGKGLVDGTAHVEGTAKVTGDWGVHQGGQALLGELGREIIVRHGRFFTVGENGAEMQNLQPGDIVFNHIQTEELLKNGRISSRGKAYANGTVNKPSVLDRLRAQGYEVKKYEWKDMYGNLISPQQMNEAAKAWVSGTYECLTPMNDFKEKIKETVKVIEGANVVNNTMNQQPINQMFNITMPNVTDSTSANVLMRDLQSISTKKLQYNWKK